MQSLIPHPFALPPNIPKSNWDSRNSSSPPSPQNPENTFSRALLLLRACAEHGDPKAGRCVHAHTLKSGLDADAFIANSLLGMYSKSGRLEDARNVFDHMPHRTVVSWTAIISAYNRHELPHGATLLFSQMLECEDVKPNEFTLAALLHSCASKGDGKPVEAIHCRAIKTGFLSDGFLQNSLISVCVKSGMLLAAEKLVLWHFKRDVVSWTSVISGYASGESNVERAVELFFHMQEDGVLPNAVTILVLLKACSVIKDFGVMRWVHGLVVKGNRCTNSSVLNALIQMYSGNGYLHESAKIFRHEGLYPSSKTMANMLQECGCRRESKLGGVFHGYLIKHGCFPSTVAENSLMNMYAMNGLTESASLVFMKMVRRDIVSWNTMMNCLVKNGDMFGALILLRRVHREGMCCPDFVTFLTSLKACADLALLAHGQVIHGYVKRTGLVGDTFVQNALIDMYAKSGKHDDARSVFDEMLEKDIGSWNSIIAAHGSHGDGVSALNMFSNLEESRPNSITFVNVLTACAHAGLVQRGLEIFDSMESKYGVSPSEEHYACVVDLLGRAGRVEEAERFVRTKPPGAYVWGALLSASVTSGNLRIAERAAKDLSVLEPESGAWRVALSNAYAAAGDWRRVAAIRAEMRESGWVKEGGWSSVNVDGAEFGFMAGGGESPQRRIIYDVVHLLSNHMRDASTTNY